MTTVEAATELGRAVVDRSREAEITFLAAAVAYYAFVSLVPLVLLAVAVASAVGGEALADRAVATIDRFATPEAEALVREALTADSGRGPATVVGLLGVLWGGLKVFRGLDRAFAAVYGGDDAGFLEDLRDAAVVLGAIWVGVLSVAALDAVGRRTLGGLWDWTAPVVTLAALAAAMFPLFYVFPDVPMRPRDALPGTLVAAVGWTLLEVGFGLYVALGGGSSLYGVLGAVLLLVTWLYVGALVVVVGAVVNATLSERAAAGVAGGPAGTPDAP